MLLRGPCGTLGISFCLWTWAWPLSLSIGFSIWAILGLRKFIDLNDSLNHEPCMILSLRFLFLFPFLFFISFVLIASKKKKKKNTLSIWCPSWRAANSPGPQGWPMHMHGPRRLSSHPQCDHSHQMCPCQPLPASSSLPVSPTSLQPCQSSEFVAVKAIPRSQGAHR